MSQEHHLALPKGHRLGKYQLDRVLGSGGFAITYLGIDVELNRRVAIKELLPPDLAVRLPDLSVVAKSPDDESSLLWARERFLDEARTIARFDHPNLVQVHEHFETNNTAYIVMRCVDGCDLNDHLRGLVPVPIETIVTLVDPLLGALGVMHESSFLHRDIKPDNIRVTPEGLPVLIDFGSARHAVGSRTRDLTTILTPCYAPFEQYSEGGNLGPWSDLYSLASVIHKMLRGTSPPEAPSRERNDPYQPLAGDPALPNHPQTFLAAVDQALHPIETKRPQSTSEWRELLWAEIDLPTGFTRVPSGRHFTNPPAVAPPPAQPEPVSSSAPTAVATNPGSKRPLILGLSFIALIAIAYGGWIISQKKPEPRKVGNTPSNPEKIDSPPDPGSSEDKPKKEPVKPLVRKDPPEEKKPPTPVKVVPPPPSPPAVARTPEGAKLQYASGDGLFFDIRKALEIRKSSSDRLDFHNKGMADPPFTNEDLAILKQSIASRDREIDSLSERALAIMTTLKEWPKPTRQEGYHLRMNHLKLAWVEKEIDTRLQQSLLSVFHDLCSQTAAGTRVTKVTIEAKLRQVPIPD